MVNLCSIPGCFFVNRYGFLQRLICPCIEVFLCFVFSDEVSGALGHDLILSHQLITLSEKDVSRIEVALYQIIFID